MLKRIFAVVSEADFYAFQKRAKEDSLTMGEAFAALTHLYATRKAPIDIAHMRDYFDRLRVEHEDANSPPKLSEAEHG